MGKLGTLKEIYHEEGLQSVFKQRGKHILISSPIAPYLKSILGRRLHHKLYMFLRLGYWPHIKNPRSFNEKILRRKLYTNNDLFSVVGDKWRVREYVSKKVGDGILPEVYHVTDNPETIPFDELPEEYVIKPTHMSGPITFVGEGDEPNRNSIKQSCEEWLNTTYGSMKEEYWYSEIKPRIIVEERLKDEEHGIPPDFKFFVFHGNVEYIEVDIDRHTNHKRTLYNKEWEPQEFEYKFPLGPTISKPERLSDMIDIAESLGEDFDFIRVDLYQVNNEEIKFGELTVGPESGGGKFSPQKYDFKLGSLW